MKVFKPAIFIIIILNCSYNSFCQQAFIYTPPSDNESKYNTLFNAITEQYNTDIDSVSGENKKYIAELYKERYEHIQKQFEDKEVITWDTANNYLQMLLKEIRQNNPVLQNINVFIFFARDFWPNASCEGDGVIEFNIGLFNRLQNEDQVCFVLCHELAHLYLNHNNNAITRYVNMLHSSEFQKEMRNVKKADYQKNTMLENITKNFAFSSRRHSREFESEADSMAIEFMKNTRFNINEALTCLALLDSVDNDKYNISPPVTKIFDSKGYPFQQNWIKGEQNFFSAMAKSSQGDLEKEKDSLKTHPDCKMRIQRLTPLVQKYIKNAQGKNTSDDSVFEKLKHIFDYEIIEYCYNTGNVSRSLYFTLQMMQFYSNDVYLITNTGRCLNKMYNAQKNHVLGKIADAPSPYQEEKYNDFLQFLGNLHLQDMASVNYFYMLQFKEKFSFDKNFREQLNQSLINYNLNE